MVLTQGWLFRSCCSNYKEFHWRICEVGHHFRLGTTLVKLDHEHHHAKYFVVSICIMVWQSQFVLDMWGYCTDKAVWERISMNTIQTKGSVHTELCQYLQTEVKLMQMAVLTSQIHCTNFSTNPCGIFSINTYLVFAISTGMDTMVVTSPLIMLAAKWHLMSSTK